MFTSRFSHRVLPRFGERTVVSLPKHFHRMIVPALGHGSQLSNKELDAIVQDAVVWANQHGMVTPKTHAKTSLTVL